MRVTAAILAAGRGERFGGDKISAYLGGKPLWRWSFETFLNHPEVESVGLVGSPENIEDLRHRDASFTVLGGETRQESSRIAVSASTAEIVLIHDAARPFVCSELISRVIRAIRVHGAAAPAIPVTDTLRMQVEGGYEIVDRSKTVSMQSPQGALRQRLLDAHSATTGIHTDEIALLGPPFEIVDGDPNNFKITTAADLERARAMVGTVETRTGIGYDIHPFSPDASRPLMIGGVHFEGVSGLEGHSDADVVIHAAVDALLGAAGLGDIGQHFPNTDPRWRGEPSLTFLRHAAAELRRAGWSVVNLDITMIAEKPKVMGRSAEVRLCLAEALQVEVGRVSFKATTNEGLGSLGRGEGIAAHAVATIRSMG
jgi:2-C-methyl-D-erythritol 4-phosphate cytidylyltransferase / 2-C-methyl-D-erythritol 2,4-cyclodiphosphate synthase